MADNTAATLDAAALKGRGFFQQADKGLFSLRLSSPGGTVDTAFVKTAAAIAETYGASRLHFTTRQQLEVPGIPAENIPAVEQMLAGAGIGTLTGGSRVRTIMACQGAPVCKFGNMDTGALARDLSARFAGRMLPTKFKIAITGCKNNCARVEGNDIGVRGLNAGFQLFFGGTYGRTIRTGTALLPVIADRDTVIRVIEAAVAFFAENAAKGERFGALLDRVGEDTVRTALLPVAGEAAALS